MPINIEQLEKIYNTNNDSSENKAWISIPDSKSDKLIPNAAGSSGGDTGNGWKIHISIDTNKMSEAARLIAEELNNDDAPRVSIKFAGKQLAATGQPSKQVAFIFYAQELENKEKITAFLNRIERLLTENNIGTDPRRINSDTDAVKTKYDAVILDNKGKPSRFNYRNEQCIVMEDDLYSEVAGKGNTLVQDQQILVKQSYYLRVPDSQKHNPGNLMKDPLAGVRIQSLNLKGDLRMLGANEQSYFKKQSGVGVFTSDDDEEASEPFEYDDTVVYNDTVHSPTDEQSLDPIFTRYFDKQTGIFPKYLKERADTFDVKDFFRDCLAFFLGCFCINFKTDAEDRTSYINELEEELGSYKNGYSSAEIVLDMIGRGKSTFAPRAEKSEDKKEYSLSLHAKLSALEEELKPINNEYQTQNYQKT